MLILNETNYSNGKVTLYDNENNVVRNGHVDVYVGTNKVSTFSLDAYGQGTPSITAGIFYRFEVFDSVGELVSILEPVSLGESSSGGVTPAALEAETAARIAADDSLQWQINGKADKSYVDDKLGQIAYDKRVIEAKINEEVTRAKDAEKVNTDAIETLSGLIDAHVSDTSNPHEVTPEQIGAAKSTDLGAYVKKAGDTMTGRLTVQTAGGDQTKAADGAMVVKMTAAANKTGISTNGSVFAGDLDNTNSNFVGVRRKTDSGAKVGARFQIYRRDASDNGTAAFMQVDYTSTATTKSIFEFGHNYGKNEDNWGTMTFGDVTKNVAYKEDYDTALNDTSESAPQTKVVNEKIKAITDLIPTAATPANQLADKAYVDFGVEQMAAKYLSATADGQPFSSYAQFQQGVFYYGGEVTEPTKNDYALVNGDETHDNAVTRYVFTTEWNFQYVVNNSPLNAEQLAALNSGINATKVGNYDSHIADTTKHITAAERTKWNAAVQPSQLAKVATTGSYNDLTGKPTIPPAITVDSAMSSTSTNPVQNKVVNAELLKKQDALSFTTPAEITEILGGLENGT